MEKRFYIEELPESKWYLWDSWLSNLPHSTPFSTSWWLSTVCNLFGGSPHIFIIKTDKDEFIGGIGLREVKFLGKSIITPSPLSAYMPLVFSKDLSYRLVIELEKQLASFLKDRFNVILSILNTRDIYDVRGFQWYGYETKVQYTAIINLEEFNIDIIDRSKKKQINKALRAEMVFELSDDVELMWNVWNKTFIRQDLKVPITLKQLQYIYRKIKENNGGQGFISFTKNGKPTSFRISMWSNPVIVYGWISGSDPDYFRDGVSSFTVWSVLQYFKERGFKLFDWCGANIESIANFKLSFGANLTPIFVLRSEPLWFSIAHLLRGMTKEMIFRKRRKNNDNY